MNEPESSYICKCGEETTAESEAETEVMVCPTCRRQGCFTKQEDE